MDYRPVQESQYKLLALNETMFNLSTVPNKLRGYLRHTVWRMTIFYLLTGPSDVDHPNMVRLSVLIPHRDGMVPAISTHVLSNFGLALSPDAFRVGLHKCSNLIDPGEKETQHTFLGSGMKDVSTEALPFQFSRQLRSEPTLTFYRYFIVCLC